MKKILLVDDDAVVRLLYQRKLEQGGFEVALAEDGLQAIQLLGAHTPDLVLLDLMMPKLSAITCCGLSAPIPSWPNCPSWF